MSDKTQAFIEQFKRDISRVNRLAPDTVRGYGALFQAVMKDGALPLKHKELIALAIGVALRCEPCIHLHVQKCLAAGATKEEILEAAGVAVTMQGGPASTYLPFVLDAVESLTGAA